MNRYVMICLPLLFGFATTSMGCTNAASVCEMICECEHCSSYKETSLCYSMEADQAAAEAYECGDQWYEVLSCTEEKGTCDEEQADFSTSGTGTCMSQTIGISCTTDADCNFGGNATCNGGTCEERRCSGSGNSCSSNSDCIGEGEDLCQSEREKLAECIADASDHDSF